MHNTPKIGELLIHAGVIDALQLETALVEQEQWGRRLGVTLIKLGMVEENHLIRALAQQLGLPATSLEGRRIAPETISLVPSRVAMEHSVIPLFVKRADSCGKLFLGMEDPSKLEVLDDLCFRTGLEIQPVMMGPTELAQAIDRYYTRKEALPVGRTSGETTIGERSLGLAHSAAPVARSPGSRSAETQGENAIHASEGGGVPATNMSPMLLDREISLDELSGEDPPSLREEIRRLMDDSKKTRLVVKALTQVLVEKQLFSLDEIQKRIADLKSADPKA